VVTAAIAASPVTVRQDTGGKVVAVPNPWRLGDGPAVFRGVLPGETIRLYTLSGELVWAGTGDDAGAVVWDGRNLGGTRVVAGLYVWATTGKGRTVRGKLGVQ
jgi:hypothetical protein